jgi:transcriptional regulator with XRE-family HTH domain
LPDKFFKDPEWLRKFLGRIEKLMGEEGLDDQKEFNERIGIQRAVTRWKTGETTPGLKSYLAIRHAFGRSLDWIIFGDEAPLQLGESIPEHYNAGPPVPINASLLSQAIAKVDETLEKYKLELNPGKKARLTSIIYEHCADEKEQPNISLIARYLLIID